MGRKSSSHFHGQGWNDGRETESTLKEIETVYADKLGVGTPTFSSLLVSTFSIFSSGIGFGVGDNGGVLLEEEKTPDALLPDEEQQSPDEIAIRLCPPFWLECRNDARPPEIHLFDFLSRRNICLFRFGGGSSIHIRCGTGATFLTPSSSGSSTSPIPAWEALRPPTAAPVFIVDTSNSFSCNGFVTDWTGERADDNDNDDLLQF
ncbi:unnamed protein product [Orchesella dallaii]|uniref:Uncharacterized protein n=1 Tax=Orchesella dallaii TaxID=48710 RepID=A0ABP1PHK0_9HEXA